MGEFFYFTLNHCGHPANIPFFDCAMAVAEGFAPKTVRAGAHPLRPSNYIAFTGVWKVRRNKVDEGHLRWDVLLTTKWSC